MAQNGGELKVSVEDIAIEKSKAESTLALQDGKYIVIRVSDNGVGIPEEHHRTIFEPYFTTKDVGQGTGMGLAVVHGIVQSFGGRITLESKKNEGTSVFNFPAGRSH